MFGGELEMKLMSQLGYDAATIGNHDFDGGIDGLAKQMQHADFPMVISNYNLDNTPLEGKTLNYKIWNLGGVKIGMYALGIELRGLVPESLYQNTKFNDPIISAHRYEQLLREEMKM